MYIKHIKAVEKTDRDLEEDLKTHIKSLDRHHMHLEARDEE
jgi:hypothetical protein